MTGGISLPGEGKINTRQSQAGDGLIQRFNQVNVPRAGDGTRTHDILLGKQAFYH